MKSANDTAIVDYTKTGSRPQLSKWRVLIRDKYRLFNVNSVALSKPRLGVLERLRARPFIASQVPIPTGQSRAKAKIANRTVDEGNFSLFESWYRCVGCMVVVHGLR